MISANSEIQRECRRLRGQGRSPTPAEGAPAGPAGDLAELGAAILGPDGPGQTVARHAYAAQFLLMQLGKERRRDASETAGYPAWLVVGVERGCWHLRGHEFSVLDLEGNGGKRTFYGGARIGARERLVDGQRLNAQDAVLFRRPDGLAAVRASHDDSVVVGPLGKHRFLVLLLRAEDEPDEAPEEPFRGRLLYRFERADRLAPGDETVIARLFEVG